MSRFNGGSAGVLTDSPASPGPGTARTRQSAVDYALEE